MDVSKDQIREYFQDLDMDKEGRVSISDFMSRPIVSQAAFDLMDKNKDGYVSKGELKLAQMNMTMKELGEVIRNIDGNSDGKLTFEEVKAIAKETHNRSKKSSTSSRKSSIRRHRRS